MDLAPTERQQQRLRTELRTPFRSVVPDGPPPAEAPADRRALPRGTGAAREPSRRCGSA
ncbi:hypothetical protein [Streptomyces sp. NPDC014894]|uniref:hypothetical protein n=1 Tax=Streptomyces sp. NPDC014894 TaxID=3364931 RepID=UPI0036FA34E3